MHWRGDRNGAVAADGRAVHRSGDGRADRLGAAERRHLRRVQRVQVVQRGVPGPRRQRGDALGRRHGGVHELHPPGHLSAEPDPQPRQLADRASSRRAATFYFNHAIAERPRELPSDRFHNCNGCHTLDPNGNAGASAAPGLLRHRRQALVRVRDARSSRSRTCATCTRRSACSARRRIRCSRARCSSPSSSVRPTRSGARLRLPARRRRSVSSSTSSPARCSCRPTTPSSLGGQHVVPPNPYGIPFIDPNALGSGPGRVPARQGDGGFALRHAIVALPDGVRQRT